MSKVIHQEIKFTKKIITFFTLQKFGSELEVITDLI